MASHILTEVKDGIGTITLNRPERMNAYTPQMGAELHQAFYDFDRDDNVRVIVVTGAGRAFCAGADLGSGGDTFDYEKRAREGVPIETPNPIRPWQVRKPIIAALNGHAVGVGITLPMQWDIRVAAESAKVGFVFVRRGITPEALSLWTVPRMVGVARANELLMTGRILAAREALEFGIVTHVWPDAEFKAKVGEMARDIADNTAPVSVAITKQLIYSFLSEDSAETVDAIDRQAL
ncbi:MAG TPA: enoyl-CoA hydratase-related protein, partial [Candidatus Binataceae bacterium]|nr:enoyl-CoA hydratase-related protein [Candidatus Binataceae bacterium]